MYMMAQQGLLRPGELLSGLCTTDVQWTGEGCSNFELDLMGGDRVIISFKKMERDQKLFAGDLLEKWCDMNGLGASQKLRCSLVNIREYEERGKSGLNSGLERS